MESIMAETFFNQTKLADRWHISPRTLERWRWQGEGPRFLKVGGRVLYRHDDVLEYEQGRLRASTAEQPASGAAR